MLCSLSDSMQAHLEETMDMELPAARGMKVRTAREKLGISRADLADALGISEQAIGQLEAGRTKDPKLRHATALEDALNIRLRWLVEGKGPMNALPTMDAYRIALGRRDEARDQKQKRAWERIAAALAKVATVLMFAIPPYMMPQAEAGLDITPCARNSGPKYTLIDRLRRLFTAFLTRLCQIRTARVAP